MKKVLSAFATITEFLFCVCIVISQHYILFVNEFSLQTEVVYDAFGTCLEPADAVEMFDKLKAHNRCFPFCHFIDFCEEFSGREDCSMHVGSRGPNGSADFVF